MAGIGQYLKETQSELRHVAWPTQLQTIVYTVLVALISIGVALYLGIFDYVFTTGLTKIIRVAPAASPIQVTQEATTSAPIVPGVNFSIPTDGTQTSPNTTQ